MSKNTTKRIIALLLTALLMFGMIGNVFAVEPETATETQINEEQQETGAPPAENDAEIDEEITEPSDQPQDEQEVEDVEEGISETVEEPEETSAPTENVEEIVPEETIQEETVSEEQIPEETVPQETVPEETEQEEIPEETNTEPLEEPIENDEDLNKSSVKYTFSEYGAFAVDDSGYEDFIVPKKGIPSTITEYSKDMFDNPFLDALTYLGYPTQTLSLNNRLFSATWYSSGSYGSNVGNIYGRAGDHSPTGISYGGTSSGIETTQAGLPDVSKFKSGDGKSLVCASYVAYVYFNYLPNVEGESYLVPKNAAGQVLKQANLYSNISGVDNAHGIAVPYGPSSGKYYINYKYVPAWENAIGRWVNNNVATYIGKRWNQVNQSSDGLTDQQLRNLPVGSILLFSNVNTNGVVTNLQTHTAIYLGYTKQNNEYRYWVAHDGNLRGPEIQTISEAGKFGASQIAYLAVPTPPYIRIRKTSDDGNVAGITFRITGNGVNWTGVTNADGELQTPMFLLKNGSSYTITEIVPEGYICTSPNPRTITVVYGSNDVTFSNTFGRGDLIINKTSGGNAPRDGFHFNIYNKTTGELTRGISEANGKVYLADGNGQPILQNGAKVYTFDNVIKDGKYAIAEDIKNSVHRDCFPDYVTISVKDANGNPVNVIKNKAGTAWVSTRTWRYSDGEFDNTSYSLNKCAISDLELKGIRGGYVVTMEFHNIPNTLSIHKIDSSGNNVVGGIYFWVGQGNIFYGKIGPTDSSGNLVYNSSVTITNGLAPALQVGQTYQIKEANCPDGYVPANEVQTITIQPGTNELTFTNNKISLRIIKHDNSPTNNIEGINFKIYHDYELVYSGHTNSSGILDVPAHHLVFGETYNIMEVVPEGYVSVGGNVKTVTLTEMETVVDFYNDTSTTLVTITKTNSDGTPPTATFNIYEYNNTPYDLNQAKENVDHVSYWTLKQSNVQLNSDNQILYTTKVGTILKIQENLVNGYTPHLPDNSIVMQVSNNQAENVVRFMNYAVNDWSFYKEDQYGNAMGGQTFHVFFQDAPGSNWQYDGDFYMRSEDDGRIRASWTINGNYYDIKYFFEEVAGFKNAMSHGGKYIFSFTETNIPSGYYIGKIDAFLMRTSNNTEVQHWTASPGQGFNSGGLLEITSSNQFTMTSELFEIAAMFSESCELIVRITNAIPEMDSEAFLRRYGKTDIHDEYEYITTKTYYSFPYNGLSFNNDIPFTYSLYDRVSYSGLIPNNTYHLTTEYYTSDGYHLEDIDGEADDVVFQASGTGSGTVEQEVEISDALFSEFPQQNVDIVVTHTIVDSNNNIVASHFDLNDADQTVHIIVPELDSVATNAENDGHEYTVNDNLVIHDKVTITNIDTNIVAETAGYYLETKAYAIRSNGNNGFLTNTNGRTSSFTAFTPTTSDCIIDTTFEVNQAGSTDTTIERIVIYEYLHFDFYGTTTQSYFEDLIASHADINDTDQTITRMDINSIRIKKVDENNVSTVLSGAEFVVTDSDGNFVARETTTSDGMAIFDNLFVGKTYYYQEVTAPDGYMLDPNKYMFVVGTNALTFTQTNKRAPANFEVRKTSDDDNVEHIEFNITKNGVPINRRYYTGANGVIEFHGDDLGLINGTVTGLLKECPECHAKNWTQESNTRTTHTFRCMSCGHVLQENHTNTIVQYSDIVPPTCCDDGYYTEELVCQECGRLLSTEEEIEIPRNEEHEYYITGINDAGKYIKMCADCGTTLYVDKEDACNVYYIDDLKVGDVIDVTEITPHGYTSETNTQSITLNANDEVNVVDFHNVPTSLYLTKVCANDSDPANVTGITFTIKDNTTNVTHTHVTDGTGCFVCDSNCEYGIVGGHSYTVTETVPSGFVASSDNPVTFTATSGQNMVMFENKKDSVELHIKKIVANLSQSDNRDYSFTITMSGRTGTVVKVTKDGVSQGRLPALVIGTPYTFTLKDGEQINFIGIPLNTHYSVTEEASSEYDTRFLISQEIDGGIEEIVLSEGNTYSKWIDDYGEWYTVENRFKQVGFSIEKTSSDNVVSGINFIVERYDTATSSWIALDGSPYTTGATGLIEFDAEYPVGTQIRVTEIVPEGYVVESTNPQVLTLGSDTSANVFSFHNIRNPEITSTTAQSLYGGNEVPLVDDGKTYVLKDTIVLSNLVVGQTYVIKSDLYRRTTPNGEGTAVYKTKNTTFTATATTQTVPVTFSITVSSTGSNGFYDFYFNTFLYKGSYSDDNLIALHYGHTAEHASEQIKINHADPLTIEKEVKGTFGDQTKAFTFTLVTTAPPADVYPKTSTVSTVSTIGASTVTSNPTTITFGTDYTFELKHGEKLVIATVPNGISYSVTESVASGCSTSWTVSGSTTLSGTGRTAPGSGTIAFNPIPSGGTSPRVGQDVKFVNDYNDISVTGVFDDVAPYAILFTGMLVMGISYMAIKKRRKHSLT